MRIARGFRLTKRPPYGAVKHTVWRPFVFLLICFRYRNRVYKASLIHKRMLQANGTRIGTSHNAGTTVITLTGIEHHGRLSFLLVGNQDIYLADIGTAVAANAFSFIKLQRFHAAGYRLCPKFHFIHNGQPPSYNPGCVPHIRS